MNLTPQVPLLFDRVLLCDLCFSAAACVGCRELSARSAGGDVTGGAEGAPRTPQGPRSRRGQLGSAPYSCPVSAGHLTRDSFPACRLSRNALRSSRPSRRARTCWLPWRRNTSASAKGEATLATLRISQRIIHLALFSSCSEVVAAAEDRKQRRQLVVQDRELAFEKAARVGSVFDCPSQHSVLTGVICCGV